MKNLNSHNFENIYKELGIDLDELGCIMIDLYANGIPDFPAKGLLYKTIDPKKFWIDGFVARKTPHITLLYGLLDSGKNWEKYIEQVLGGWKLDSVKIKEVGYFESPYKEEPYYCIVAHVEITPELQEGHDRLSFLPHINTFPGYKAHFTLAYIKKDEAQRDIIIDYYNKNLVGKEIKIQGINLGGKP